MQNRIKMKSTIILLKEAGFEQLSSDSSSEEIGDGLRKLTDTLKGADNLTCGLVREQAIGRLEQFVRAPARLFDAAFKSVQGKDSAPPGESEPIVAETEPWEEPVDGVALLDELTAIFNRFLVLPDGAAETEALWILHTHCFDTAYFTPYLNINSPEPECGKTTNLDLLGHLTAKPLLSSNITAPAVFRTVETHQPTLLIDEADTFLALKDELRGVLNSGNRKTTAFTVRLERVGDGWEPRRFSTWCPKAFSLIGRLPLTLEGRSIVVTMQRKTRAEQVEEFNPQKMASELETLQRKCARWARDNLGALTGAEPPIPDELHNRIRDKWKTLLAIAEVAGGDWPERTRKAALSLSVEDKESSIGNQLLADIKTVFDEKQENKLPSATITWKLSQMNHRPWVAYKNGCPITQHQIAKLLSRYGIKSKQLWIDEKKTRGYERAAFTDAFTRYLPEAVVAVEPSDGKGLSLVGDSVGDTNPTASEKAANPHEQGVLPDLPSAQGVDNAG